MLVVVKPKEKITLKFLKRLWDKRRLEMIKMVFVIGSDKLLVKKYEHLLCAVDVIWSDDHDETVRRRNKTKKAKHIFISQICDVAVEEYKTVCKLCEVTRISLVGDKKFVTRSKSLLKKKIKNVEFKQFII